MGGRHAGGAPENRHFTIAGREVSSSAAPCWISERTLLTVLLPCLWRHPRSWLAELPLTTMYPVTPGWWALGVEAQLSMLSNGSLRELRRRVCTYDASRPRFKLGNLSNSTALCSLIWRLTQGLM